jgi:hypothetical protein
VHQETQLAWVAAAILNLGGPIPVESAEPPRGQAKESRAEQAQTVYAEDVRDAQAFVDRWRPRAEALSDARHRRMIQVILGEALEQKRFFEQALAGRTDLLGLRSEQVGPRVGEVLATRWVE